MMNYPSPIGRSAPRLAVILALLTLLCPRFASAEAFDREDLKRIESKVQTVAERAMPAIVALTHRVGPGMASGTGTIVSKDGIVLTAAHVVAGVDKVEVTMLDGTTRSGKVLGGDATRDVALVRINEPGDYPFVEMGKSKPLKAGDLVVAMGHAGGFDRARKPPVRFGRIMDSDPNGYLRTDCVLIGGDSGGPLLDLDGAVVGVHSSIGMDVTINNDVPVDVAHDDWARLLAGEHWGTPVNEPPRPRIPEADLAGLDLRAFRRRIMSEARAHDGQLETNPKTLAEWLVKYGMDEKRVKDMSPEQLSAFIAKIMGGAARAQVRRPSTQPSTQPAAAADARPGKSLEGLDQNALRRQLVAEARENDRKLDTSSKHLREVLVRCGASAERVGALSDEELTSQVVAALNAAGGRVRLSRLRQSEAADLKAIETEDRAILATERPDLEKAARAVVTLLDGDNAVCLGTIVRADGFVLTKRSEIAKAKSALKVRLPDGRSFDARSVKDFPDDDLAIVHIAAEGLNAVTFAAGEAELRPGSFLASPGTSADNVMLGLGVVSVPTRSLRDTGGYIGIFLSDSDGGVKIGMLAPGGPAEKAGLHEGDILEEIDGNPIKKAADLSRVVRALRPGTVAKVTYHTGDKPPQTALVTLGDREKLPVAVQRQRRSEVRLAGNVSDMHSGFPSVFQHDQPIGPADCGGPVIDLHGDVVGLNIARAGRIETYAIPAATIARLLEKVNFDKLGKP